MRNSFTILVGISMIAAFACGGSSKAAPPAASPTPVSDEAFKAAATTASDRIQIAKADLPAGWAGKPHVKSDTQFDLSPECAAFNDEGSPNAVVDTNSDDFTDTTDRTVSSGVTIYRTAELASQDYAKDLDLFARCREEIAGAMEASIVKNAPGATARVTFDLVAPSELGGWTNGYKVSVSAASANGAKTYHSDVTVFVKIDNRIITTFAYDGDTPIDARLRDALKSLLAKRTADAEGALPL